MTSETSQTQPIIEETDEFLQQKYKELRAELAKIEAGERHSGSKTKIVTIERADEDAYLLRYLRVAKFDLDKALRKLFNTEAFLRDHFGNDPNANQMTALRFKRFMEHGLFAIQGPLNKAGQKTLYATARKMDYYRFPAPFTRVACFYFFEKLLTLYGDDLGHGGLAMLADCSGMGWANFDLSMEKYFSEFMSDALPIKIGCMAMAKQPMLFTAMMALIKPFLSTKMKQRLLVVGTDYNKLKPFFDASSLPVEFGGTWEAPDSQWVLDLIFSECDRIKKSAPRGDHTTLGVEFDTDFRITKVRARFCSARLHHAQITPGSLANKLGLHVHDFVRQLNGAEPNLEGLLPAADEITVTLRRVVRDVRGRPLSEPLQFDDTDWQDPK